LFIWGGVNVDVDVAAIYSRLSKEDVDKIRQGDESASIQNQKLLLINYAIAHQFSIYDIYSDDDYSGLDGERPDFNRLIKDAKAGCFKVIICKTQARFTRDMELVEKYIHGLFPSLGIRFIGVVDNADTDVKGNKKARQINGLVNEWYSEDLSENIRSVFKNKMERGEFLGSYASYGYSKHPEDNHKLIIDEEAAEVVRKIFSYAVQGLGNKQICNKLYEEAILTPSNYKKLKGLTYQNVSKGTEYGKKNIWGTTTIQKLLCNRMYIGDMVQGREKKVSYKSKKVVSVPESEWVIVPGCHEAIIDKDTFDLVQSLKKSRRYASSVDKHGSKQINLLAGKVKCKDCGSTLCRCNGDKKYVTLYCQLYVRTAKKQCSSHSINYRKLIELLERKVKDIIQTHLQQDQFEEYLTFNQSNDKLIKRKQLELSSMEDKLSKTKKALAALYVDKVNQIISEDEYNDLKNFLSQEAEALISEMKKIEEVIQSMISDDTAHERKDDLIRKFANFERLDHEIINEFVDYIEVGEKDREKNQEIIIHWRF
jgi:site-specific DNA recombinase